MATVSTLVVALTAQTTDFERGLKSVEKSLDRTAARFADLGASMTAGLTAPLAALATAATKLALDFDAPFDKMQSVLGQSAQETDALRDSVLKLAGQTAQSPKELGDALLGIESAGIRGKAALDVLTAAAEASAIGLGSTKQVASFLAAELNAYGPKALSAAQATSVLVEAARVGRLNIDELVGSVGSLMPIAAQAGVSFDQVAAAIAAMTRAGLDAGQATTGLRTILETIEKPSTSVQKALAMVGLSADTLKDELQSKGLLAALEMLKTSTEGNDEAISKIFPNARTFAGVLSLLGANSTTTEGIFKQLAGTTTNTLATAFNKAATQDGFKFQQALVQIQTALIRLGNDLLPIIVPLVERFTQAVTQLSDWFEHLDAGGKDLAVVLLSLVASVGPLLLFFAALYSSASTLVGAFRLFLSFPAIVGVFQMIGTAAAALKTAFMVATMAAADLELSMAPLELMATALSGSFLLTAGLVVAAAYMWISKWQELKEDMGQIIDFIVGKLQALNAATRGFMGDMFNAMFPGLALLVQMKPAIAGALGQAADAAVKAGTDLKAGFLTQLDGLEHGAAAVFARMISSAKGMATGVVGSVQGMGGAAPALPSLPAAGPASIPVPTPQDATAWKNFTVVLEQGVSGAADALTAFKNSFITTSDQMQAQIRGMAGATAQSMGAMTANFLQGKENLDQFVSGMIQAIERLIIKIMLLKALTAAGMGGDFATGFIGGFAEGGRPPVGQVSIVGEHGPELFVPDTAGTVVPNNMLGGGGGASVTVQQTVQISGLDLGSASAARLLAVGLKEAARSGAAEGIALSLQLAQTASKNSGRAV